MSLKNKNLNFSFIWIFSILTVNVSYTQCASYIELADFNLFKTFYQKNNIILLEQDLKFILYFFDYYKNINIFLNFNPITYQYFYIYFNIKTELILKHKFSEFLRDESYKAYIFWNCQSVCWGSWNAVFFCYLLFGVFVWPTKFLLPFISLDFDGVGCKGNFQTELTKPLPSDIQLPENFQQVENSNNNQLNTDLQPNQPFLEQTIIETKSNYEILPALSITSLVANTPFRLQVLENRISMSKSKIQTLISTMPKTARSLNALKLIELGDHLCIHKIKGRTIHTLFFQHLKNESNIKKIKLLNSIVCSLYKEIVKQDSKDVKLHSKIFLQKSLPLTPEIIQKLDNWTFCKLVILEKEYPYNKK